MKNKAYDNLIQHRLLELVTTPWKEQLACKLGIIDEKGSILVPRRNLTLEQRKAYPSGFYAHAWRLKQILEHSASTPTRTGQALSKLFDIRESVAEDMVSPRKIDEIGVEIFKNYEVDLQPILEENYDALPLVGTYEIQRLGKVEFNEPSMPIGDIAGFPVYSANILGKTHTFTMLEAKKLKTEDGMGAGAVGGGAPVNNVGSGNIAGVSPGQEPPGPKGGFKALAKMKKRKIAQLRRDAKTLNVIAAEKKQPE